MPDLRTALLNGPFHLSRRPEPISGDLRIVWGTSLLLLILGKSRSQKASLRKLHFLAYAARTARSRRAALQLFGGERPPTDFHVRVEPWVNRALVLASANGLMAFTGRAAQLSPLGARLYKQLAESEDLLRDEQAFLSAVAKEATENAIERAMRMEPIR